MATIVKKSETMQGRDLTQVWLPIGAASGWGQGRQSWQELEQIRTALAKQNLSEDDAAHLAVFETYLSAQNL